MIQQLYEMASYIQYSEVLGWVLLVISALLSALFSEMLVQYVFHGRKLTVVKFAGICIIVFAMFTGITILLIRGLLHFFPQQENFWVLLKKTGELNIKEFIIPLATTLIAGWILSNKRRRKKWANTALCLLLVASTLLSSVMFFWNSFQMIQRPRYDAPVEAISSIINSRLSLYPFILSGYMLEDIGDGNELISEAEMGVGRYDEELGGPWEEREEYQEPNDFRGYIYGITEGTYAPGMDMEDYLNKAYTLFVNGRHNNDYFCIGLMWNYIYDCLYLFYLDPSITADRCLDEAIIAYQKYEEIYGGEAALYINMAIIYGEMGNRLSEREYTIKALEFGTEGTVALSNYLIAVYGRIDERDYEFLMEDAEIVLTYEKNLSMYILYAACAVAENKHVENAYNMLCEADKYFKGKSAMVKILRCICADLISVDDISTLHDIYVLEDSEGLTREEEVYLLRYLFAANRYGELWGYIADVGTEEDIMFDAELVAIKASWYFENPGKAYDDTENVELLLQRIENGLDNVNEKEDRDLLLLSQILLKNCLGETETLDMAMNGQDDISDLQYKE